MRCSMFRALPQDIDSFRNTQEIVGFDASEDLYASLLKEAKSVAVDAAALVSEVVLCSVMTDKSLEKGAKKTKLELQLKTLKS